MSVEFKVGDWVRIELDGCRGVEGEVTCVRNRHGHGECMVHCAIGGDVQCYLGRPFAFTPGPHVRLLPESERVSRLTDSGLTAACPYGIHGCDCDGTHGLVGP
jgi:hypothetical protein